MATKIRRFTYKPFLYRLKGDHRAFYFDILVMDLFGNDQEAATEFEKRKLKSNDGMNVDIYLKLLNKFLSDNMVGEQFYAKSHNFFFEQVFFVQLSNKFDVSKHLFFY